MRTNRRGGLVEFVLCKRLGEEPAAVAPAWPLHNPAVMAPIAEPPSAYAW